MSKEQVSQDFREAEASFLASTAPRKEHSGRRVGKAGRRPKPVLAIEAVTKLNTVGYFRNLIDDETEAKLWMMFITGKAAVEKEGQMVIEDIEPNPVSLRAFMRAVEYKRGMPVVTVREKNDGDANPDVFEVRVIGATPQYFEDAAKAKGFLTRSV